MTRGKWRPRSLGFSSRESWPTASSQWTILVRAFACLAGAIWFAARRRRLAEHIRPIYIERGIVTWNDGTTQPVESGRIR